jgi:hypothetical protein
MLLLLSSLSSRDSSLVDETLLLVGPHLLQRRLGRQPRHDEHLLQDQALVEALAAKGRHALRPKVLPRVVGVEVQSQERRVRVIHGDHGLTQRRVVPAEGAEDEAERGARDEGDAGDAVEKRAAVR